MTGALAEDTLTKCLMVNDSLCQVLEFVEHPERCQGATATDSDDDDDNDDNDVERHEKDDLKNPSPVNDFDAFGIGDDDDLFRTDADAEADLNVDTQISERKPAAVGIVDEDSVKIATSTLDDLLLVPTPAAAPSVVEGVAPVGAAPAVKKDEMDDFDDFFNDRLGKE